VIGVHGKGLNREGLMRLTTRGRYAVTAMLDLAIHGQSQGAGQPLTLAGIAGRQEISVAYLEQLFAQLRRAGLVRSVRGPGGGYSLARPASEISLAEVVLAVDEDVDPTRCGGLANCHHEQQCLTHDLWVELGDCIRGFLARMSLADLAARDSVRAVAARQATQARTAGEVSAAPPGSEGIEAQVVAVSGLTAGVPAIRVRAV